jgi:hypothetical protein
MQSSYAVSLDGSGDIPIWQSVLFDQDIVDASNTHDFVLTNTNGSHLAFDSVRFSITEFAGSLTGWAGGVAASCRIRCQLRVRYFQ